MVVGIQSSNRFKHTSECPGLLKFKFLRGRISLNVALSLALPYTRSFQEYHSCQSISIFVSCSLRSTQFLSFLFPSTEIIIKDSIGISLEQFSSVQLLSCVRFFLTPWTTARQTSLSITNSWSLLRLMSLESVMTSNHLILCHPLLLLPSIFPSIRVFSSESVLHIRWTKNWSFSFSISLSNEYSRLISFQDGLVGSLCCPRDSQESSPTPQFKSINASQSNSHIHT